MLSCVLFSQVPWVWGGRRGWWLLVDSCTSYSAASSLFPIGFFLNTTLLIPVKRTASQPTLSSSLRFLPPFRCKLSITEMIFFSIYIYKKFFRCDLIFIFLVISRWCDSILYLLARVLTSNWQFFYLLHLTFIFIDEMFYDLALSLARSLSLSCAHSDQIFVWMWVFCLMVAVTEGW